MAKAKKAGKAASGSGKAAPASTESLLVGSKVRGMIKAADCNTAGDALDGLNQWVGWLINQATIRAKANGRKTVRAHDFMAPM